MSVYVCVKECLMQQLSTSWRIRSSGNHSLSMYGSSCGSPCLILHACRECHNTFTSHSSTSSQGQAREENCSYVSACALVNLCTVAPYICMRMWTVYACMHMTHVCLLAHMHACLCLVMYKHLRISL